MTKSSLIVKIIADSIQGEKMKIAILGSGSSGNSIYIESKQSNILVDAGFSGKVIKEKMEKIGKNIDKIKALLVTHEHGDHIASAGILVRRHKMPIYITRESFLAGEKKLGTIDDAFVNFIEKEFKIDDLNVKIIDVLHDAQRTVAFLIESDCGKRIGIATDIGHADNAIKFYFQNLDILIIESNYDYNMLMTCAYPADLKSRIKSNRGHFSNEDCGKFITEVYHEKLKKVYLVHISRDSNTKDLAYKTVKNVLEQHDIELDIEVVPQDICTQLYHLD